MKKITILLSILLLWGCAPNIYKELGYTSEDAKVIKSFKEENQAFFNVYDDYLVSILNNEDLNEEKLPLYVALDGLGDADVVVELVNEGIITNHNIERVKTLVKVKEYDQSHLKEYLKFYPRMDDEILVRLINDGKMEPYSKIVKLANDPYFVYEDLDVYLEHYEDKEDIRELIEYINSKAYMPPYYDCQKADVEKYGYHVLVNKYNKLDANYEPDDLVDVESAYGRGKLRKEAYEAYKKMQDDAAAQGYYFYITSPYRSYDYQNKLYNKYLASDTQANVDTYSARPGHSEHQLGLAIDILKYGYDFGNFYLTPEAQWLKDNAYKYGFIFRYPADKVAITGYKYEPWHYRYVGDIAEDVYNSGLTYDEYFEKFIKEK